MEASKLPCENCRQRKVKCDRTTPDCAHCRRAQVPCRYSTTRTSRPGLRAGYVQRLQHRLESLEQEVVLLRDATAHKPAVRGGRGVDAPSLPLTLGDEVDGPVGDDGGHPGSSEALPCSRKAVVGLVQAWFDHYDSWFPILHRPSTIALARNTPPSRPSDLPVVLRAIWVAIGADHGEEFGGKAWHPGTLNGLRRDLTWELFTEHSCAHLQAGLILAMAAFGKGDIKGSWKLIALCKRISMQLGLRDLVVQCGGNFEKSSLLPPRMLNVPETDVAMEEHIRAFWMTEAFDSASTIGVAWNLSVAAPEPFGLTPCGEADWLLPEGQVKLFPFGSTQTPSSFALYLQFVNREVWRAHQLHQQVCDAAIPETHARRRIDCDAIEARLSEWHAHFLSVTSQADDARSVHGPSTLRPDVHVVLVSCVLDMTIITLYQRLIDPTSTLRNISGKRQISTSSHETNRCLAASDRTSHTLRQLPDSALEYTSPQIAICAFVAARFYLLHARLHATQPPNAVQLLLYVLRSCSRPWALARRLANVVQIGIVTAGSDAESPRSLPRHFWDLRYSWQDIDHALELWDGSGSGREVVCRRAEGGRGEGVDVLDIYGV